MEWKDLKETVGRVAPLLGTVIAGPAGGTVGSLLAAALNVGNDADSVKKALETDPNAAIKLKELQVQEETMLKKHIENMANIELKYEETRVEERKSAHNREIKLAESGKDNSIQPILATIGVGAFFFMTGYMLTQGVMEMSKEASFIVGNMTGLAGAIAKDVYGYYFGSSSGSKEKTLHLSKK